MVSVYQKTIQARVPSGYKVDVIPSKVTDLTMVFLPLWNICVPFDHGYVLNMVAAIPSSGPFHVTICINKNATDSTSPV